MCVCVEEREERWGARKEAEKEGAKKMPGTNEMREKIFGTKEKGTKDKVVVGMKLKRRQELWEGEERKKEKRRCCHGCGK